MKACNWLLMILFLAAAFAFAEEPKKDRHNCENDFDILNKAQIDIDDGSIILTNKDDQDEMIEITEDYELYLNGKKIKTNERQQRIVKDYYEHFMEIIDSAKELGLEGAKIGLSGAKIGLQAVVGLLKLLDSDYDSNDLERDLNSETDKLEHKAGKLEKKAQKLEKLADDFEEQHLKFKNAFPELKKLEWI